MAVFGRMENALDSWGRSHSVSPLNFQYACAMSGLMCLVCWVVGFASSGFIPSIPPWWDAQQTAKHYRDHETGIQAGTVMMLLSAILYLPFTIAMARHMQCIPNIDYVIHTLQLAAGIVATTTYTVTCMALGTANFRLAHRPPEITQAFSDLYWIASFFEALPFTFQSFAFAYATIVDPRPRRPFPKSIALINIAVPVLYFPSTLVHCTTTGVLAWNGAISYWVAVVGFFVQILVDVICLVLAAPSDICARDKSCVEIGEPDSHDARGIIPH
ncbi:hypothetical protein CDD81_2982 [Ophiocordyceps australis]|uniref:Uncharacterized protein n=1 Tax=Ophiocordyceps australis TaxID=1399860 RepID=A0A2C5YHW2_9HYPO|nr:hypothetical protein CDD81_2982 [Ophiocordyceps australis]